MIKYRIAFKDHRKFKIEAPTEARAKEWAERQLAHWREKYEFVVTDLTAEEAAAKEAEKAAKEAAKAEKKKEKKTKEPKQ